MKNILKLLDIRDEEILGKEMTIKNRGVSNAKALLLSIALALVFTVSLTFATLELPRLVHKVLINFVPEYPISVNLEKVIGPLRPYGYVALITIFMLALLGFVTKKFKLTVLSSVAVQLSTFGHFALTMFVFAGIGVVRLIWLPVLEISPRLLRLGDVVLLPLFIVSSLAMALGHIRVNIMNTYFYFSLTTMFVGTLILFTGVTTWLYGKLKKVKLIDFWIYKYSRHPQYLGFLIYSYGLLILSAITPAPRGGYFPPPTLPWSLATLLIIDVAILEEIKLKRKLGELFESYRKRTPFMLPLPRVAKFLIELPSRLVIGKSFPEDQKEVIIVTVTYAILLIILSIPSASET